MSWLKRKKAEDTTATAGQHEASKALGKAEERLEKVEARGDEIMSAAETLRRLGDHNDFAARIKEALGGAP